MPIKKIAKKVLGSMGYDLRKKSDAVGIPISVKALRVFRGLLDAFERVSRVPGDVVECGVERGRSFLCLAHLVESEGPSRRLWGYDSFEGFPEPSAEDASSRTTKKGQFSQTSVADVLLVMKQAGIQKEFIEKRVTLVPGFFDKSLKSSSPDTIALLHLDVDLYQSYRDCLDVLYPKVSPGGVILFDEYEDKEFPGAKKAVDEFFGAKNVAVQQSPVSLKYFAVKPGA